MMTNDIETLRKFIHAYLPHMDGERGKALAALERVENAIRIEHEWGLDLDKSCDSLQAERDSPRAKLEEIEQVLTDCGFPAEIGNPPTPWPAVDRIKGLYVDYLRRHHEACERDLENFVLHMKLAKAREALESFKRFKSL